MRTKEEIQGEIDKVKGFIESGQKELEVRTITFDRVNIYSAISQWKFRIGELTKELEELEKINKEKEEWKSMIKMALRINERETQKPNPMQEKKFKQFYISSLEKDESFEIAKMNKSFVVRKINIDLAKVATYRQGLIINEEADEQEGTTIELDSGSEYATFVKYKDFDRIMREAFPEAY
jgi:hypothetical protein